MEGKYMSQLKKFFKLEENNTTVKTEVIAGLVTFFAMCYILVVNPLTLTGFGEQGAMFIATILASAISTLVIGLFANIPYAAAPGLGLNNTAANILAGYTGYLVGLLHYVILVWYILILVSLQLILQFLGRYY